jgi:hypothetical protein
LAKKETDLDGTSPFKVRIEEARGNKNPDFLGHRRYLALRIEILELLIHDLKPERD